jgi:hypothetical protein
MFDVNSTASIFSSSILFDQPATTHLAGKAKRMDI